MPRVSRKKFPKKAQTKTIQMMLTQEKKKMKWRKSRK